MREPISFRPIRPDDAALLLEIYASTRTEELAQVPWTEAQKIAFLRMQFDAQHRFYQEQFPDASFQVILLGDRPIGRLYLHRRDDELHIIDIALLPAYRRTGLGGALLRDVLAEADAAGKPVRIHVERFNPALRLYERLGFSRTGDTGVYFLMEHPPGGNKPSAGAVRGNDL
jgi:ribosomal protein S18 acetylase RimI-like enzyme